MTFVTRQQVLDWIEDDVDPTAVAELRDLVDRGVDVELEDRFATELTFGTAGLRGPLRAGPNGMNRTVVRRAAAGVVAWLTAAGRTGRPVVICFDARYGSTDFAQDSAAILQAAGFDARLLPGPLPTPVLAFSVRHQGAAAGIMVTASHNPPQDNGYKVYDQDGGQIVSPVDRDIETAIRAVPSAKAIPLDHGYTRLGSEIVTAYLDAIVPIASGRPRTSASSTPRCTAWAAVGRARARRRWLPGAVVGPGAGRGRMPTSRPSLPQPRGAGRHRPGARRSPSA